jgi:dihydrofolate reductase
MIKIVVAYSNNQVIGDSKLQNSNGLLWHIPEDLKHFKQQTINKNVVFGRKTFQAFGSRPLPNRNNIILTRDRNWQASGVKIFYDLDSIVKEYDELIVAGGAEIYKLFLPIADELIISKIKQTYTGDILFPEHSDFMLTKQELKADFSINWYKRA